MKQCKLEIGAPVYQDIYQYPSKKVKKLIKDECRKHLILRFSSRLGKEFGEEMFQAALSELSTALGNAAVVDLSEVSWGEQAYYDENTDTYYGAMCIAKDFENMAEQKVLVSQLCRDFERRMNNKFCIRSIYDTLQYDSDAEIYE